MFAATWAYRQRLRRPKWFLQISDASHQLLVTVGGPGASTDRKMDLAISLADVVEVSTVSYEITWYQSSYSRGQRLGLRLSPGGEQKLSSELRAMLVSMTEVEATREWLINYDKARSQFLIVWKNEYEPSLSFVATTINSLIEDSRREVLNVTLAVAFNELSSKDEDESLKGIATVCALGHTQLALFTLKTAMKLSLSEALEKVRAATK